jgi:TfoX/Sxy family transcriptional regulator of competence genes
VQAFWLLRLITMVKKKPSRSTPAKGAAKKTAVRPKLTRSPDDLVALFDATMNSFPDVEVRKVFGYPCGFVNGNMAVGLHADAFFVRLAPEEQHVLLKKPGGGYLEPMPGRPMRDYVIIPVEVRAKKAALKKWVEKAIRHSRSLPTKKKARS